MHSFPLVALSLTPFLAAPTYAALAPNQITHFVTFGDSYTDVFLAGDGGRSWPLYVMDYVDAGTANASLTLHPYAMSGGICSHALNNLPWPSVLEEELPAFYNDSSNGTLDGSAPGVLGDIAPDNTLYSIWLGTNDVGAGALLTGEAPEGVTVVDTVACTVNWVKTLYDKGARNFLFQNMNPLEKTPMYSRNGKPTGTWTASKNATEWNIMIHELTTAGNKLAELMLQQLVPTLDGAHVALFDSHSLFNDMIANPEQYLNGTAPVNLTTAIRTCDWQENEDPTDTVPCTVVNGTDRDSYMWQDELHPSEQADRIVAQQIAEVLQGEDNKYTTWLS
ncbi:GDSL lipase/esterase [Schizophyllum commune]